MVYLPTTQTPDRATGGEAGLPTLRLAIVSTPRTGNTWLRRLLDGVYGLPQVIVDQPDEIAWKQLPERCLIQLHWPAERELVKQLAAHGVRVVTSSRHPFDTLISILHFAGSFQGTDRWVGGRKGGESHLVGVMPASAEFLKYGLSPRARMLLSISTEWARQPGCLAASYEALVRDTLGELTRLTGQLAPVAKERLTTSIAANAISEVRGRTPNQHCWLATPGYWTRFLPSSHVEPLAEAHAETFRQFNYTRKTGSLDEAAAANNWLAAELTAIRQEVSSLYARFNEHNTQFGFIGLGLAETRKMVGALQDELRDIAVISLNKPGSFAA